jgi:hypothetical protein
MSDDFKLTRAAGLRITNPSTWPGMMNANQDVVRAAEVEAWLASAPDAWGYEGPGGEVCASWEIADSDTDEKRTLTAKVVCVRKRHGDTAESLLREFMDSVDWTGSEVQESLRARARQLLAKGE